MFNGFNDLEEIFSSLFGALFPTSATHLGTLVEVLMALLPIITIFIVYELSFKKLPKNKTRKLIIDFSISYVGLMIFLTCKNDIMSPFGSLVGVGLGAIKNEWIIIGICFVIGLVTVLCEPAVHILTNQINAISDGSIKRKTVMISLSIGVGVAIGLATIRTIFDFNNLYIIVPGYLLLLLFMFICPDIYTMMDFLLSLQY